MKYVQCKKLENCTGIEIWITVDQFFATGEVSKYVFIFITIHKRAHKSEKKTQSCQLLHKEANGDWEAVKGPPRSSSYAATRFVWEWYIN